MPKHTFYKKYVLLNNLQSKHSLAMKFCEFMPYYNRKMFIKKFYKKCDLTQVPGPFVFMKKLYWKMKFLKQADYIEYVMAKLSKYVEIGKQTFTDSFSQWILEK